MADPSVKKVYIQSVTCPVCGSHEFIYNEKTSELICAKCGYVLEEVPYLGREWRILEGEDFQTKARTGSPMSYSNIASSLSTEIGRSEDLYKLSSEERRIFEKLKKWQQRAASSYERNLKLAQQELKRLSSLLQLPQHVEETAMKLYLTVTERGLIRGRSIEAVVAACVYIACRMNDVPRTLDEVVRASGVHKKELGRTYRQLTRTLKIKILPIDVTEYVHRFSTILKLPPEVTATAIEIIQKAKENDITAGRGPAGIAAAAVYLACVRHGIKKTQKEIAEIAGVTEVTVRNRYKELIDKLGLKDIEEKLKNEEF